MSCEHARELMDAALDGEKPPELAEHLIGCAACAAEWGRLVALEHLLRTPLSAMPPAGFHGRVMTRVDLDPSTPWLHRSDARALLSVATLIAGFLLVSVGLLSGLHALQQPEDWQGWLAMVGAAAEGLTAGTAALLGPGGQGWWGWALQASVAVALALIWFGTLVAPRFAERGLGRR